MFCAFTRPRYQVSVYRTIGPLVVYFTPILELCWSVDRLYLNVVN